MFAVGKHVGPMRQVGAAGINEINARQQVLARDLLRAQVLLHRHRIVSAAFDRRIVADDHTLAAGYPPDAGDNTGAGNLVLVDAVGRKRRQFKKRRACVDKRHHTVARQELAA